jgi:hypothetical protein
MKYTQPAGASSRAPIFPARLFADEITPEPPRRPRKRVAGLGSSKRKFRVEQKRISDVNKVLNLRHGGSADPGWAQHLAEVVVHMFRALDGHPRMFRGWCKRRAPSLSLATVEALIVEADEWAEPWNAAKVGIILNLSWWDRRKVKAWHILPYDRSVEALAEDCRINKRERDKARGRQRGAKPREESAARKKPWDAEGVSERTWYRRKRASNNGSVSRSISMKENRGSSYSKRVILPPNAATVIVPPTPAGAPEARPATELAA